MLSLPESRVLIIDPEPNLRHSLSKALRSERLIVDGVADGTEALSCLQAHPYVVVLLDVRSNATENGTVLEALAVTQATSRPVVIVFVPPGHRIEEAQRVALIHGIVKKPFEQEELVSLVAACARVKEKHARAMMALASLLAGAPLLEMLYVL